MISVILVLCDVYMFICIYTTVLGRTTRFVEDVRMDGSEGWLVVVVVVDDGDEALLFVFGSPSLQVKSREVCLIQSSEYIYIYINNITYTRRLSQAPSILINPKGGRGWAF